LTEISAHSLFGRLTSDEKTSVTDAHEAGLHVMVAVVDRKFPCTAGNQTPVMQPQVIHLLSYSSAF
jgi:hypothetical protein